ncbi:MAG: Flp family type IVb pilin [Bdellovibrionota bacterium]
MRSESGQTTVEYILMLSIVVSLFVVLLQGLNKIGMMGLLMKPLKTDFALTYKNGHPKAKGFDDGGPENHPRIVSGGNFRIFINPAEK